VAEADASKRRYERYDSRLRCWCEGDAITVFARILNLSEGGLFVRTSTPLHQGARAWVRFGGEETVELPARVVWARFDGAQGPAGMGLAFEGVDDNTRGALKRIIEQDRP
jgi:uncharacterized protein (TIGR02266 family)